MNQVDSYRRMRTATEFSDVTLVCEDGRQIYAHRVILASSSSFFQGVLTNVMHSHPLIFLRGVPHSQLSAIMDFIYLGQAEIRQEDLDAFMEVVGELGIKGIETRDKGTEYGKDGEKSNERQVTKDPISAVEKLITEEESDGGLTSSSMPVESNVLVETPHVDEASLLMEDPLKFKCDECGRTYKSKPSLSTHKSLHKRMKRSQAKDGKRGVSEQNVKKRKQDLVEAKDGKRAVSEQNVRQRKQILGGKGVKQNGRKGKRAKGGKRGVSEKNTVMDAENENIPPKDLLEKIPTEVEGMIEKDPSEYNGSAASSEGDAREGQGSLVKDSLCLDMDPQPAQWRADELFGKRTSSSSMSGSSSLSSSFLPNLSWTPPGAADPVLDVATAVVDAVGDLDN